MAYPARLLPPLIACLLAACSSEPPASAIASQPPAAPLVAAPVAAPATPSHSRTPRYASFAQWQQAFRRSALQAGISASTLDRSLSGLTPDPAVIAADSSQPEFTRPVWEYLDGAVSPSRVSRGSQLRQQQAATLSAIEQRYGVDGEILLAIWGMESAYGHNIGNKSVIRSLASLAYQGRRAPFWEQQLLAALRILEAGDVDSAQLIGSWAGAMGQTQFMPTTYAEHAVDFDGDGRRDLWKSSADALASAAHYLQNSGWQAGQPWGLEVRLPASFDFAGLDLDGRLSLAHWARLGLRRADGQPLPAAAAQQASLLLPAGHRGPAFLVLDNFRAILRYNNSTSYALAVGLLSDRLQGQGQLLASWPRNDRPLSRSQRIQLQQALTAKGFNPGVADGVVGANTRKALRAYQQSIGVPADGYATVELLEKLSNPD